MAPRSTLDRLWDRLWQAHGPERSYVVTRFVILRLLGLIYLMAFLTWVNQGPALIPTAP